MIQNDMSIRFPELDNLRDRAYQYLSPKRVPHVEGCEEEAVRLAERWGADVKKAAESAILHDVTKKLSYSEQLRLIEKYAIVCDSELLLSKPLLHAVTGAAVAEIEFGMDESVCNAIRWHTTGREDMLLLEKIVYLADFIEPTRDFPGVEKLRTAAYENLNHAVALGLKMSMEDVRSRGEEPYYITLDAFNFYKIYE